MANRLVFISLCDDVLLKYNTTMWHFNLFVKNKRLDIEPISVRSAIAKSAYWIEVSGGLLNNRIVVWEGYLWVKK